LNIIVGLWVLISSFVLAFAQYAVPMWNNIAVGGAIALCAVCRLSGRNTMGWSWLNVLLGAWLIISPFVLGFANLVTPLWNNIICGVITLIIAGSSMAAVRATPKHYEKPV
jgi:hypothetical protein